MIIIHLWEIIFHAEMLGGKGDRNNNVAIALSVYPATQMYALIHMITKGQALALVTVLFNFNWNLSNL